MTRNLLTAMALVLAAFLVYSQVHTFEFVNYDDGPVVFENESFKMGSFHIVFPLFVAERMRRNSCMLRFDRDSRRFDADWQ